MRVRHLMRIVHIVRVKERGKQEKVPLQKPAARCQKKMNLK